jgi:addiction module HigA family antidote
MEPLGLSSYRLATELHVSAPRINDLVRGKRSMTADTAMRLSRYFGTSAQLWLGLQMDHDIWLAAKDKSLAKVKPRAKAA